MIYTNCIINSFFPVFITLTIHQLILFAIWSSTLLLIWESKLQYELQTRRLGFFHTFEKSFCGCLSLLKSLLIPIERIRNSGCHLDSSMGTQKVCSQILHFLNYFCIINYKQIAGLTIFLASNPLHLKSMTARSSLGE